jgi:hypothetical protein
LFGHDNLRADSGGQAIVFVNFAVRINVHAVNMRLGAEIIAPHLKAAAAGNSDLCNVDFLPPKTTEMPLIDLKIV